MKKKVKFKIPMWKLYLYDFCERFKIYRRINQGKYTPLFKLKPEEGTILKYTLIKFGKGGVVQRENKFQILNEYLKLVETNYARVSLRDIKIAHKISPLRQIKGETIMSELLKIKAFGKEVGLGFSDMKNLSEEALVAKIVQSVDAKGKYSDSFYKWYEKLEKNYPSLFESGEGEEEEVDIDQIVDAIENADDIDELKEILDVAIFSDDKKKLSKIKKLEELQEAMMEIVTEASEGGDDKKKSSEEIPEDLVEAINASDDVDELKEICQSDEYKEFFSEISMRGKQKAENLKAKMLDALGVEKTVVGGISAEELEAELNEMSDKDLKAKAKELDIKAPALMTKKKKEELIAEIVEKSCACESVKEEETEITPAMVKKAVLAKDLDTLLSMCEALEIKPKILQKKNAKALGEMILEGITEEKPEKVEKEKKGGKKVESIYSTIENLVKEGKKSFGIVKEVTPMFEALGQDDKDFIKEKVKAMMEIAELELSK